MRPGAPPPNLGGGPGNRITPCPTVCVGPDLKVGYGFGRFRAGTALDPCPAWRNRTVCLERLRSGPVKESFTEVSMARMTCRCGQTITNGDVPGSVLLWVFTDHEWADLLRDDTIETWRIPLPPREVWKCPVCQTIYVYPAGGGGTHRVHAGPKRHTQLTSPLNRCGYPPAGRCRTLWPLPVARRPRCAGSPRGPWLRPASR